MKQLTLGDETKLYFLAYPRTLGASVELDDLNISVELGRQEIYDLYNWLADIILDDLIEDEKNLNS
jgi:hypothetical protein